MARGLGPFRPQHEGCQALPHFRGRGMRPGALTLQVWARTIASEARLPPPWPTLRARSVSPRPSQEQFTRTFDVFPFEQPHHPQSAQSTGGLVDPATKKLSSSTTGSVYGFGSASLRFQNEVYGCHLAYGKVNKAVIELADPEPGDVAELQGTAPSRMLPDFAAKFKPELGRTFATTVSRDAPPGRDGASKFWVQPKDTGGIFPGTDAPEIFSMGAPRGAGPPSQMHVPPTTLLTPAERREALVFDKCHQRARLALRKAANDACQLTRVMQQRYPNGVLGLEGPGCPDSVIYEQDRRTREGDKMVSSDVARRRFDNISARRDSQLDYKLLTHDHANSAKEALFPRKAPSSLGLRGAPTSTADPMGTFEMRPAGSRVQENGFRSNQEKPMRQPSASRAGALHSAGTRGKGYDIISGASLPVQPGAAPPMHYPHDRRAHPSNLSMPHSGVDMRAAHRGGTAPTLIGPIPDAHMPSWQPASPVKSPTRRYFT